MLLALHPGFEVERPALLSPFQPGRNQVQIIGGELRGSSSRGRGDPDLRMLAFMNASDERDALAILRPSRRVIRFVMVRNLDQRSARSRNYPYVGIAALVKSFASPVRYER